MSLEGKTPIPEAGKKHPRYGIYVGNVDNTLE
jgi:hypothetical protein